jgi:hypothetical protein
LIVGHDEDDVWATAFESRRPRFRFWRLGNGWIREATGANKQAEREDAAMDHPRTSRYQ